MSADDAMAQTALIIAERRLAKRAAGYGPSVWGEADELVGRYNDVIYFGSGAPASELYPLQRLEEAAAAAWSRATEELGYGYAAGYPPLRELIAARMAAQGIPVDPEHVMIT